MKKNTFHISFKFFCSLFFSSSLIFFSGLAYVSTSAAAIKVGLVLDKGGKDDKSFNSSAFEGAKKAEKELGIELKFVEAADTNAFENLHKSFSKKKMDLIIGIGFAQLEAIKKVSKQFPEQKFALVDGELSAPNVKSILFEEHEGSFLVGALAALKSKTSKFGFIGGMDIPLIRRFFLGYEAGVKKINPNAQLLQHYIGVSGEAWNNPAKAKELAMAQFNQGVEVIFVAAGASGSGVFDATEEVNSKKGKTPNGDAKFFAIGVDSNQNWIKPGLILSSMLKRVDIGVFETIKEVNEGKFQSGIVRYGLKSKAVDYAVDKHNSKLITADITSKLEDLKKQILEGKIKVPDYYQLQKK